MPETPSLEVWKTDLLVPAPDNPRADLGDLTELADSIKANGLLQPIVATTTPDTATSGRLLIVAGHRRHGAALLAEVEEVDVLVHQSMPDLDRHAAMAVENLQRVDLTAIEKARSFKALADAGLTQRQIAERVGVAQGTVSKHLSLLKLPEEALGWLENGEITQEDAVTLANLPSDDLLVTRDGTPREHPPTAWQIEDAKRRAEGVEKTAAELENLKAAGVKILTLDELNAVGYDAAMENGPIRVSAMYWIKAKAHEKAECRAVALTRDSDALIEICTAPKNHPKPKETSSASGRGAPKLSAADQARRDEVERLKSLLGEANSRRVDWLRQTKPAKDRAASAAVGLLLAMMDGYFESDYAVALHLLGVDATALNRADMNWSEYQAQAKDALFAASDKNGERALLLLLASTFEAAFDPGTSRRDEFESPRDDEGQAYLAALSELGYEASWIESKFVGLPYEEPELPIDVAQADAEPVEEPTAPAAVGEPIVTVLPKKQKHYITCSACGHVGINSKEEDAIKRAQLHAEEHRAGKAAA